MPTRHDDAPDLPDHHESVPTLLMCRAFLEGQRGLVYGPLDLRSDATVTLIVGERGSGLTSLLLSIAGRMTPGAGAIATLGHDVAAEAPQVRALVGIAGFDAIDALDGRGTVGAHLRQRWSWNRPWYARRPKADDAWTRERLGSLFGPVRVPDAATRVEDLAEEQTFLLRVALALMDRPRMLAIDDLDAIASPQARSTVMRRLVWLGDQGFPIVAATHDTRDIDLMRDAGATDLRAFRASDGAPIGDADGADIDADGTAGNAGNARGDTVAADDAAHADASDARTPSPTARSSTTSSSLTTSSTAQDAHHRITAAAWKTRERGTQR